MKKMKIVGFVAIIYLALVGIGFLAGTYYQRNNVGAQSGGAPAIFGKPPEGTGLPGQGGTTPGGEIQEQVKSIDRNKVT